MSVQIQVRRDISTDWTSNNPTLAEGEIGFETDTGYIKVGDGTHGWTTLDYFGGTGGGITVKEDGSVVLASVDTVNVGHALDTSDASAGHVTIVVDDSEIDHDSLLNVHAAQRAAATAAALAIGTAAVGSSTKDAKEDHVHPTGAGTPSTQAFADSAAIGSGPAASMTDHKHAWPSLGTSAEAVGTSAGGSATTPSKSDHVHASGAGTPSTQAFGDSAVVGSGPAASMTDHKHAMPTPTFSVGGLLEGAPPPNGYRMVWRAPFACTVTNVRTHFDAGTNIVCNARRNQTSNFLSSNYTNSTANAWGDAGTVQNTAIAVGDDIEINLVSTSGAVTKASIQVDLTRP